MIHLIKLEIGEEEISTVEKVLRSGLLVQGKNVETFEEIIADYLGIKFAIAVSSGTAALHLSLLVLEIGPGDEVIVPDFTFPATGNVVALIGAKPVLVDIDLSTYNIDPQKIEEKISSKTKAIIPVHLFGQPADMDSILEIARRHNLHVIEDAACALGAIYKGKKCGTIGDVGCFSFHPRKIITTGEGGMVVTNNKKIAERIRSLRNHGITKRKNGYSFEYAGFNYRMTDFQGAIGVAQMKKLDEIIEKRREIANLYTYFLKNIKKSQVSQIPVEVEGNKHIYQSYVILLGEDIERDKIIMKLRKKGIETTIGTYALHCQPFYKKEYGYKEGTIRNSYETFKHSLALPLHQKMKKENIKKVAIALKEVIKEETT